MSLRYSLIGSMLILIAYGVLCYMKAGEVLQSQLGTIVRCEQLAGATDTVYHATVRTEHGQYLIAKLTDCQSSESINVLVKRGALFFNTVYEAVPR